MYNEGNRQLQERFDTRRLADRLEEKFIAHPELNERSAAFIEAADMFFIATADADGRPSCSYEGGEPSFVRVLDERTIAFPSSEGNGLSPLVNPHVGLLFISFVERKRLRLQGIASHEPQSLTRVSITEAFPNCPRYIHQYELVQRSHDVTDRVEERLGAHGELDDRAAAFIEAADMFFIATADADGRPTCSYKGGDPGLVRVLDERTIAFPCYDGNGMFLTTGNMLVNPNVGLLFISFEQREHLRLQGLASHNEQDELMKHYPEAQFVTRVAVTDVLPDSPRPIHKYRLVQRSRFVPKADCETPAPAWKREDWAVDVLRANDPALEPDAEIIHKG